LKIEKISQDNIAQCGVGLGQLIVEAVHLDGQIVHPARAAPREGHKTDEVQDDQ
jgi:hypothetical protein